MSTNQKPTEIITGVVLAAFDEDDRKPGKIRIENQLGEQDIAVWPNRETGTMPNYWVKLQANGIEAIIGQTIKARCIKGTVYSDRQQWNAQLVEVVEDGETGSGRSETPAPLKPTNQSTRKPYVTQDEKPLFPAAPAVDTRQTQIMLQNATGHSTAAYNTWIKLDPKTRGVFKDYLADICEGATWILENHYVPCGYKGTEPAKSPEQDNYEGTSGVLDVME